MCFTWFWQQFRPGKFETSIFFVLESSAKVFYFVLCGYETNIQQIAVQERAWMWIKINYYKMQK